MALPNYDQSASASQYLSRNQIQRQRKRDRRQENRADKRARQAMNQTAASNEPSTAPPPPSYPEIPYTAATRPGYQGPYNAPANDYAHPFYDPNATYKTPGQSYSDPSANAALQTTAKNASPAGAYYGHVAGLGYGGLDARSQAVQGMYGEFAKGYEAARLNNNFELDWQQYMDMQDIPSLLEQMTNEQLGIDLSRYRGRDRWSLRGN